MLNKITNRLSDRTWVLTGKLIFSSTILALIISMTVTSVFAQCVVSKPKGLYTSDVSACTITLNWDSIPNIAYYKVKYKESASNIWTKISAHLTSTSYTFNDLNPNTTYNLSLVSYCSSSIKSNPAKLDETTPDCSAPVLSPIVLDASNNIHLTWSVTCGNSLSNQVRYRKKISPSWIYITTGVTSSATITGLDSNESYLFQVLACSDTAAWSAIDSFRISTQPNILVIMLDDARWDSYSCNGAPAWFQSPGFDRIANEGVNFKNNFTVSSLCGPSRATFYTGLYPHSNGAYNNEHDYFPDLPTTGLILNGAGYFTSLMGKFLKEELNNTPQPGWDFWMAKTAGGFNYNGTLIKPAGAMLEFLTDSFYHVFERHVNRSPVFMVLAYSVPHSPYKPFPQDSGVFAQEVMPFPASFISPAPPVPSFYLSESNMYTDSATCYADIEGYYEELLGADRTVAAILDSIAKYAPLEKFMIIFTSDNGKLLGEHKLNGKRWPYNESIRVPLFIRYPEWFPAGSLVTNEYALNLDLAPTILEAAGITNTYGMQGVSLRDLYQGTRHRKSFYYECIDVIGTASDFRTVRSQQFCYTKYLCDSIVEQFFDLGIDPLELTNQVYNSNYQSKLDDFRNRLNTFASVFKDTVPLNPGLCYEKLPDVLRETKITAGNAIFISPNPADGQTTIQFVLSKSSHLHIKVYDVSGKEMATLLNDEVEQGTHSLQLNTSHFAKGVYLVKMIADSGIEKQKLIVQ